MTGSDRKCVWTGLSNGPRAWLALRFSEDFYNLDLKFPLKVCNFQMPHNLASQTQMSNIKGA